jgi:RimJ/RimL family protein N-acetyltransferase
MKGSPIQIRRASPDDAEEIARVIAAVAAERVYSAIDRAWPVDEQRAYMATLSPREAFHVAVAESNGVVGYQSLDRYSSILQSMAHVGALGTFLLPEWRGRGVGRALFAATRQFAESAGYRKLVIQVRGSNAAAQAFYQRLGFTECGRLRAQVIVDGTADDEVMMELFLDTTSGTRRS